MVMSPQVSWLFFNAASEVPIADPYGSSEQRGKNSQLAAARRVALKIPAFLLQRVGRFRTKYRSIR
jgi:hypothetical protein